MSIRLGPTTIVGPNSPVVTHPTDSGASHSKVANQMNAVRVTGLNIKALGSSVALSFAGEAGRFLKPIRGTVHVSSTNGAVVGDGSMNVGITPAGSEVFAAIPIAVTDAKKWGARQYVGLGAVPQMPADTTVWYFTVVGADTGAATICLVDLEVQYEQF